MKRHAERLLILISVFSLLTCKSWMESDDFLDTVDEQVRVASADKINVYVKYASTNMGTTSPAGSSLQKVEVPFTVSGTTGNEYGFKEWIAFTSNFINYTTSYSDCYDGDSYLLKYAPNVLPSSIVSFSDPTSPETSVTIHENRNDIVIVPLCAKRAVLDDMITSPPNGSGLKTNAKTVVNQRIKIGFDKYMDFESYTVEDGFDASGNKKYAWDPNIISIRIYTGLPDSPSTEEKTDPYSYFMPPQDTGTPSKVISLIPTDTPCFAQGWYIDINISGDLKDSDGYTIGSNKRYWYQICSAEKDKDGPKYNFIYAAPVLSGTVPDLTGTNFEDLLPIFPIRGYSNTTNNAFFTTEAADLNSTDVSKYVDGAGDFKYKFFNRVGKTVMITFQLEDVIAGVPSGDINLTDFTSYNIKCKHLLYPDGTPGLGEITENFGIEKPVFFSKGVTGPNNSVYKTLNNSVILQFDFPDNCPDGFIKLDFYASDYAENLSVNPYSLYLVKDTEAPDIVSQKNSIESDSSIRTISNWYNKRTIQGLKFMLKSGMSISDTATKGGSLVTVDPKMASTSVNWIFGVSSSEKGSSQKIQSGITYDMSSLASKITEQGPINLYMWLSDDVENMSPATAVQFDASYDTGIPSAPSLKDFTSSSACFYDESRNMYFTKSPSYNFAMIAADSGDAAVASGIAGYLKYEAEKTDADLESDLSDSANFDVSGTVYKINSNLNFYESTVTVNAGDVDDAGKKSYIYTLDKALNCSATAKKEITLVQDMTGPKIDVSNGCSYTYSTSSTGYVDNVSDANIASSKSDGTSAGTGGCTGIKQGTYYYSDNQNVAGIDFTVALSSVYTDSGVNYFTVSKDGVEDTATKIASGTKVTLTEGVHVINAYDKLLNKTVSSSITVKKDAAGPVVSDFKLCDNDCSNEITPKKRGTVDTYVLPTAGFGLKFNVSDALTGIRKIEFDSSATSIFSKADLSGAELNVDGTVVGSGDYVVSGTSFILKTPLAPQASGNHAVIIKYLAAQSADETVSYKASVKVYDAVMNNTVASCDNVRAGNTAPSIKTDGISLQNLDGSAQRYASGANLDQIYLKIDYVESGIGLDCITIENTKTDNVKVYTGRGTGELGLSPMGIAILGVTSYNGILFDDYIVSDSSSGSLYINALELVTDTNMTDQAVDVKIKLTDGAGNMSAEYPYTFRIDATPPVGKTGSKFEGFEYNSKIYCNTLADNILHVFVDEPGSGVKILDFSSGTGLVSVTSASQVSVKINGSENNLTSGTDYKITGNKIEFLNIDSPVAIGSDIEFIITKCSVAESCTANAKISVEDFAGKKIASDIVFDCEVDVNEYVYDTLTLSDNGIGDGTESALAQAGYTNNKCVSLKLSDVMYDVANGSNESGLYKLKLTGATIDSGATIKIGGTAQTYSMVGDEAVFSSPKLISSASTLEIDKVTLDDGTTDGEKTVTVTLISLSGIKKEGSAGKIKLDTLKPVIGTVTLNVSSPNASSVYPATSGSEGVEISGLKNFYKKGSYSLPLKISVTETNPIVNADNGKYIYWYETSGVKTESEVGKTGYEIVTDPTDSQNGTEVTMANTATNTYSFALRDKAGNISDVRTLHVIVPDAQDISMKKDSTSDIGITMASSSGMQLYETENVHNMTITAGGTLSGSHKIVYYGAGSTITVETSSLMQNSATEASVPLKNVRLTLDSAGSDSSFGSPVAIPQAGNVTFDVPVDSGFVFGQIYLLLEDIFGNIKTFELKFDGVEKTQTSASLIQGTGDTYYAYSGTKPVFNHADEDDYLSSGQAYTFSKTAEKITLFVSDAEAEIDLSKFKDYFTSASTNGGTIVGFSVEKDNVPQEGSFSIKARDGSTLYYKIYVYDEVGNYKEVGYEVTVDSSSPSIKFGATDEKLSDGIDVYLHTTSDGKLDTPDVTYYISISQLYDFKVDLKAEDNADGSGISNITYKIAGGDETAAAEFAKVAGESYYTASVTLSKSDMGFTSSGDVCNVTFTAYDRAGNDDPHTVKFIFDDGKPYLEKNPLLKTTYDGWYCADVIDSSTADPSVILYSKTSPTVESSLFTTASSLCGDSESGVEGWYIGNKTTSLSSDIDFSLDNPVTLYLVDNVKNAMKLTVESVLDNQAPTVLSDIGQGAYMTTDALSGGKVLYVNPSLITDYSTKKLSDFFEDTSATLCSGIKPSDELLSETLTTSLGNGSVEDNVGNSVSVTVYSDETPPSIIQDLIADHEYSSTEKYYVKNTDTEHKSVTIYSTESSVSITLPSSSGYYNDAGSLIKGWYTNPEGTEALPSSLTVTVDGNGKDLYLFDNVGNYTKYSITFVQDNTKPTFSFDEDGNGFQLPASETYFKVHDAATNVWKFFSKVSSSEFGYLTLASFSDGTGSGLVQDVYYKEDDSEEKSLAAAMGSIDLSSAVVIPKQCSEFSDGKKFEFYIRDNVGNVSDSIIVYLQKDNDPPDVLTHFIADHEWSSSEKYYVNNSGTDYASVTVYASDTFEVTLLDVTDTSVVSDTGSGIKGWYENSSGTGTQVTSLTLTPADTASTKKVYLFDNSDNYVECTVTCIKDVTAPALSSNPLESASYDSSGKNWISSDYEAGTGTEPYKVSLCTKDASVDISTCLADALIVETGSGVKGWYEDSAGNTPFAGTVSGNMDIYLLDNAGNFVKFSIKFSQDTEAPALRNGVYLVADNEYASDKKYYVKNATGQASVVIYSTETSVELSLPSSNVEVMENGSGIKGWYEDSAGLVPYSGSISSAISSLYIFDNVGNSRKYDVSFTQDTNAPVISQPLVAAHFYSASEKSYVKSSDSTVSSVTIYSKESSVSITIPSSSGYYEDAESGIKGWYEDPAGASALSSNTVAVDGNGKDLYLFDNCGNKTKYSITFIKDDTPPSFTSNPLPCDAGATDTYSAFAGSGNSYSVTIYSRKNSVGDISLVSTGLSDADSGVMGWFSDDSGTAIGSTTVDVTAGGTLYLFDMAGNYSTLTYKFVRDTTPPKVGSVPSGTPSWIKVSDSSYYCEGSHDEISLSSFAISDDGSGVKIEDGAKIPAYTGGDASKYVVKDNVGNELLFISCPESNIKGVYGLLTNISEGFTLTVKDGLSVSEITFKGSGTGANDAPQINPNTIIAGGNALSKNEHFNAYGSNGTWTVSFSNAVSGEINFTSGDFFWGENLTEVIVKYNDGTTDTINLSLNSSVSSAVKKTTAQKLVSAVTDFFALRKSYSGGKKYVSKAKKEAAKALVEENAETAEISSVEETKKSSVSEKNSVLETSVMHEDESVSESLNTGFEKIERKGKKAKAVTSVKKAAGAEMAEPNAEILAGDDAFVENAESYSGSRTLPVALGAVALIAAGGALVAVRRRRLNSKK